ncbi:unnamed protein product [Didymodactylos carnosus]|uniref:Gametogenetin-binding protein 2 n=1 Tax=Didymodactylos carnosus TaxID=1234261 RepID=A0A814GZL6_9BILA|nr:unnamed protein product [Didymodactylos carnosus]CAF1003107.1 unnamed protein product [Didymodactylos carnosus]CAF3597531.1 unnamed protein product [Didymodactylos carnosus]CAF3774523.1 unnamed protein product [Didymodactylos carnosus]
MMYSCDNSVMPSKPVARLVSVCQKEDLASFDTRQIPISLDDTLIMKLQFYDYCFPCDPTRYTKLKSFDTFLRRYQTLTHDEIFETLCVSSSQLHNAVTNSVACIGCRKSIENFLKSLMEYRHPALEPLSVTQQGTLTLEKTYCSDPQNIYTLLYVNGSKLNTFIDSIPKSKKNRRCFIHSLDKSRSINDWQEVWERMSQECREEAILVDSDGLLDTLENYLRKHKFCSECKTKVLRAYDILVNNVDHTREKGFCSALYDGLRCCSHDKHIHVQAEKGFVGSLILRAEQEIQESRRERHAKTLDIAQEEILTCLGFYLYERFHKISQTMRSEEQTWQLLFYIGIDCLRRNFEIAVERKQGFSTLELLYEEFRAQEEVQTFKKQQRRLKRKLRRQMKNHNANEIIDNVIKITKMSDNNLDLSPTPVVISNRRRNSSCESECSWSRKMNRSSNSNKKSSKNSDNNSKMCDQLFSLSSTSKVQSCPSSPLACSGHKKTPMRQPARTSSDSWIEQTETATATTLVQETELIHHFHCPLSKRSSDFCQCVNDVCHKQKQSETCLCENVQQLSSTFSCSQETLFSSSSSSSSSRICPCHKQNGSTADGTRTDLGYSSGQDDVCECSCSTADHSTTICPTLNDEESSCCILPHCQHNTINCHNKDIKQTVDTCQCSESLCKTLELFDVYRTRKLKVGVFSLTS